MKKRIMAAIVMLFLVVLTGAGITTYATGVNEESETELVLVTQSNRSVQTVAGRTVHVSQRIKVKEGDYWGPEFTIASENNKSISFKNIKVRNTRSDWYEDDFVFIGSEDDSSVTLEYDIVVDDFASIGKFRYYIGCVDTYSYDTVTNPDGIKDLGKLSLEVSVISEKIPPQMSIVSGTEYSVNAGETLTMKFTMENQGELKAMDTYVEADYLSFGDILIPKYTPLKQKLGNLSMNQSKEVTLTYKVSENAQTQTIKLPINVTYKLENGDKPSTPSVSYVYIHVTGKPVLKPEMAIVSGTEHYVNAGETVEMKFTLANEGEAKAMDVSVEAGYSAFDKMLIPKYTPLKQKFGNVSVGQNKEVTLKFQVAEDAETQIVKLPIYVNYTLEDNTEQPTVEEYIYVYITGKPEVTPTPTPEPKTTLLLLNTVKQSPEQPKAGEKVKVSFYLENAGTADVQNIKVSATGLSSTGFEPMDSEPYKFISEIAAGNRKKVEMTFKVGVDITPGLNTLNIQYSFDVKNEYGVTTETENVTLYILDVQNPEEEEVVISRPKLMVSNFYTNVEEVKAGNVFDFTFEIINTNDSIAAKNIKVTVTGASNAFSVTTGGNSFFVSEIKPQENAPITINLKASAAATTGAYPIQIKIEYEYEGMVATSSYGGEVVEEEILLQVKENLRPSVENVYVGSWDTPTVNQPTVMNFEFYNMGKSMLNNTYVTIEGDFMLANGSNSFYIGNIAAGMPEYIEFDVIPLIEGDATGKMIIHMEDSNGDEVTMEKEFTAYVMGEMMWEDPGFFEDPGYMDPGYVDPSMPVDGDAAEKPILPLWIFLCIQGAILVIVIPVTRAIRLSAYRRKIKKEDAI